jgi:dihydroorotate dehydrogenase electron transfer subunit
MTPTKPNTGRGRFDAIVEANRSLCREHYLLRLRITGGQFPPTKPGQFIQLGCRTPDSVADVDALMGHDFEVAPGTPPKLSQPELCGKTAMLRRPFSLAGRGDDTRGTWIEVVHRVVGVGTAWLEHLSVGATVDLIGPLGNIFELPTGKSIGLMVGGGVGLPPMFYLAEAMHHAGWDGVGFVGAMTRDLLAVTFSKDIKPEDNGTPVRSVVEFANHGFPAAVTTDDGSLGLKGRITAGLDRHLSAMSAADRAKAVVFTCGPEVMMHAVADLAEKFSVDCQVCLEQAMACGMSTCQSCVVKIEDRVKPQATDAAGRPWRFRLACTDGPVFTSKVVVW